MKELTPTQLEALRLVATGTVSYNEGLRDRGRFTIRRETINRSTMHALGRRGLTVQEAPDHWHRRRVALTPAGRQVIDSYAEPKENP